MARARPDPDREAFVPVTTKPFEKDIERLLKRRKDVSKLWTLVGRIVARESLPESARDHKLGGKWEGWRD